MERCECALSYVRFIYVKHNLNVVNRRRTPLFLAQTLLYLQFVVRTSWAYALTPAAFATPANTDGNLQLIDEVLQIKRD